MLRARSGLSFGSPAPLPGSEAARPRRLTNPRSDDRSSLISPVVLRGLVRFADFTLATGIGAAIAYLLVDMPSATAAEALYIGTIVATSLAAVLIFDLLDLYSTRIFPSILHQLPRVLLGWMAAFAFILSVIFFFKAGVQFSRIWLALWFVVGLLAIAAERIALFALVRRWTRSGRLYRRAVIYGIGPITERLIRELEADVASDVRIIGVFDDRKTARANADIHGYARLGSLDDLLEVSREMRIDLAIVALPVAGEKRLTSVVGRMSVLPADIKLPAQATQIHFSPRIYSHVGPVAMIDLYDKPIADWGTVAKWLFDKTFGLLALIALAPLMAAIAVAIKLDSPGPVLFRQKRYGFNNELVEICKFRSMYIDRCDANADQLVTKADDRVTRVGRFLRKTSLDELSQLLNVIKGELSLVGPRPHALSAKAADRLYGEVVAGYFARHKVKPGITGWAQIHGWRGETDTPEKIQRRVDHDIYYIENWSVFLDLYILLRTPLSLFKAENAY
jgi:Undecaprenyl-phosphate glucose phosphotransferase